MQLTERLPLTRLAALLAAGALLLGALLAKGAEPAAGDAQPPKEQVVEPPDSSEAQIARLVAQLGDKEYFVRQQAQTELAKFGFRAFDALSAATADDDLEIATRARYLLRLMRVEWTAENDPPEVKKLLADYEGQAIREKMLRMRALADLPKNAGLPAVCRLVRFEKSSVCSKHAAITLFRRGGTKAPLSKELADTVRKNLDRSNRTAVKWLLVWLRFADDPPAALADWTKLMEEEQTRLRIAPGETSSEIVAALLRLQIGWLKKLGDADRAVAAMHRLIDLEPGDPETLSELLNWLIEQKAWKVVEELSQRFQAQFRDNAVLLYALAQAYAEQSDKTRAESTAEQARKLNPGAEPLQLQYHLIVGHHLQKRGLFAWAEGEYRQVIGKGVAGAAAQARGLLAEMLHDQSDDLRAAQFTEEVVKAAEKQPVDTGDRSLGETRSRMHYFFACHFQSRKDAVHEREHLLKALETDAPDIDALIACYRCAGLGAGKQQETLDHIKKTATALQEDVGDDPKDATLYNQYAWLVGNTEGDLDLALKYSQKSLELSPENGGYYDTLAHVYFGKGDYENAVRTQTKAAELEPHSGLIRRELKLFREMLQQHKPQEKSKSS